MLDVDDIVIDGEIAEVGKKSCGLRFLARRLGGDEVGVVEEIPGAEDDELRFGQSDTFGDENLHKCRDAEIADQVGFVRHVARGLGAGAKAIGQSVFAEDFSHAFKVAGVSGGEDDAVTFGGKLLRVFNRFGKSAVEAAGGLRLNLDLRRGMPRRYVQIMVSSDVVG